MGPARLPEVAGSAPLRRSVGAEGVFQIIWDSAVQSLVRAIMVLVLGSVAAGMLGSLWKEMTPSPPPSLRHKPEKPELEAEAPAAAHQSAVSHSWSAWPGQHPFRVIFVVIFVPTVSLRLAREIRGGPAMQVPSRTGKILTSISENWFHLVVGNAFGAAISAAVVGWVSQWTPLGWMIRESIPEVADLAARVLGRAQFAAVHDWFAWYGANQFRFTFWAFYLAAIVDDLGLPNLKTLGRWLGRKVGQHRKQLATAPAHSRDNAGK